MNTYELRVSKTYSGEIVDIFMICSDGTEWIIPKDKSNSDYQQYLIDTDGGLLLPESTTAG
jgi:hypothetical protein